jgi:hypothetical protein
MEKIQLADYSKFEHPPQYWLAMHALYLFKEAQKRLPAPNKIEEAEQVVQLAVKFNDTLGVRSSLPLALAGAYGVFLDEQGREGQRGFDQAHCSSVLWQPVPYGCFLRWHCRTGGHQGCFWQVHSPQPVVHVRLPRVPA